MFAKNNNAIDSLKASIFLTNLIFDNSKVVKLYGITPLQSMVKVSKRVGWKHEGVLSNSFMTKEGDIKDQYIFGITRQQNNEWRNK
jgi:hypothetical protein